MVEKKEETSWRRTCRRPLGRVSSLSTCVLLCTSPAIFFFVQDEEEEEEIKIKARKRPLPQPTQRDRTKRKKEEEEEEKKILLSFRFCMIVHPPLCSTRPETNKKEISNSNHLFLYVYTYIPLLLLLLLTKYMLKKREYQHRGRLLMMYI